MHYGRFKDLSRLCMLHFALAAAAVIFTSCTDIAGAAEKEFYICARDGSDDNPGTAASAFATLERARVAVRRHLAREGNGGDIVVNLRAGDYRLEETLELGPEDSGRGGGRVTYRSLEGPGAARLLGSRPVTDWEHHRGAIWKAQVEGLGEFHTLYENGRRVYKARYPNHEHHPGVPTARAPYLVSGDGSAQLDEGEKTSWLTYGRGDLEGSTFDPAAMEPGTMKINVFPWGKADWHRWICSVTAIDPAERKLSFNNMGDGTEIGENARFFLEDHYEFLEAPGEFYLDREQSLLYYIPLEEGADPKNLSITAPLLHTLIRLKGEDADKRVENISFEGLFLGETDGFSPTLHWWMHDWGMEDEALVWSSHAHGIEIVNCHLKNSGRSGILMAGGHTENLVEGCRIEQMGIHGIALTNRFPRRRRTGENKHNVLTNNRIHDVGQLALYASCVGLHNVKYNEVSFSELYNSPRYAVTMRGNTSGPRGEVFLNEHMPPARGNVLKNLRVFDCGHDSGDMGAVHAAGVNIDGGGNVNTFRQITIENIRAAPCMQDWAPDGIFLDWPRRVTDQKFIDVQVAGAQGLHLRSNRPDNEYSSETENVSWRPGFDESRMDYSSIGVTPEYPEQFGGRGPAYIPPAAAENLELSAKSHDRVQLSWQAPGAEEDEGLNYAIFRDGEHIATASELSFTDTSVRENTRYMYSVRSRRGAAGLLGVASEEISVRTEADRTPLELSGAAAAGDLSEVALLFNKAVDPASAEKVENYRISASNQSVAPAIVSAAVDKHEDGLVLLELEGRLSGDCTYAVSVENVTDRTSSANPLEADASVNLNPVLPMVHYPATEAEGPLLLDAGPNPYHAHLMGSARLEAGAGRKGNHALYLGGTEGWVKAPSELNPGAKDWTVMAWFLFTSRPHLVKLMSKGRSWESPNNWSLGTINTLKLRTGRQRYPAGVLPETGTWVHIAFKRKGDRGIFYLGGEVAAEVDMKGAGPFENDEPLLIGKRQHDPDPWPFSGLMNGFRMYDCALDSSTISTLMRLD